MPSRARVFQSSVGTKILIGLTGLALVLYLVVHVAGNMMVFFGPEVFNRYAYTLEGNPLIPIVEIGLLLIFLVHVFKTIKMFLNNQRARPVRNRSGGASGAVRCGNGSLVPCTAAGDEQSRAGEEQREPPHASSGTASSRDRSRDVGPAAWPDPARPRSQSVACRARVVASLAPRPRRRPQAA